MIKKLLCILVFISGCATQPDLIITDNDLNEIATQVQSSSLLKNTNATIAFWSNRLNSDTTTVGEINPLAKNYELLYSLTGNPTHLLQAEALLKKGIEISAHQKDSYSRLLAQNYLKQHKFIEAKFLLENLLNQSTLFSETYLVLFDVYMQIGEYKKAETILKQKIDKKGYAYYTRSAAWNYYKQDISTAINQMKNAVSIAESSKNKELMQKAYAELASLYFFDGNLFMAYEYYSKIIKLEALHPNAIYQIARIIYSTNKDPEQVVNFLNKLPNYVNTPEILEFKAELYVDENYKTVRLSIQKDLDVFYEKNKEIPKYRGVRALRTLEKNAPSEALSIYLPELQNRKTPEVYALYAYLLFKNENKDKAIEIIDKHVVHNTQDPQSLFYIYLIYDELGLEVEKIKKQLQTESFMLEPRQMSIIESFN